MKRFFPGNSVLSRSRGSAIPAGPSLLMPRLLPSLFSNRQQARVRPHKTQPRCRYYPYVTTLTARIQPIVFIRHSHIFVLYSVPAS
jgi:hypothetical protein